MVVGFTAVIVSGVIGTTLGIVSGYLGGWVDQVIMRITDTWLALPALTFAIFLAAIVGPSEMNIVIILAAVYWTRYARIVRGEVLSLKEREFVRLAIVAGCSKWTIMTRHILPNVINSSIVLATLMLGVVIITEASLSFLGVGVPPPKPAWGVMLSDGKQGLMVGYDGDLGAAVVKCASGCGHHQPVNGGRVADVGVLLGHAKEHPTGAGQADSRLTTSRPAGTRPAPAGGRNGSNVASCRAAEGRSASCRQSPGSRTADHPESARSCRREPRRQRASTRSGSRAGA